MSDTSKLYVITPTGDRAAAFKFCIEYVNRQTRRPDMWIIVDDGTTDAVTQQVHTIEVPHTVIRLDPIEGNSICRNIREALLRIPDTAFVCIMEDDDWYPAEYLDTMYKLLSEHPVAASRNSHYYNVRERRYHVKSNRTNLPMHGNGFAREALASFREFMQTASSSYSDAVFSEHWKGDRAFNDAHRVIHITGFGSGRPGTTRSHRIGKDDEGWTDDPNAEILHEWVGDDVFKYAEKEDAKVYVISNVEYGRENRISVRENDLLVFLNKARSIDYYNDHENKVVYHRSPKPGYGDEILCARNRYVYDAGMLGIPDRFIRRVRADYDWDYPIAHGKVKSTTTGYMVAKYMRHAYPLRDVVLVNFGYDVAHSTYRCPWHNWGFEAEDLSSFKHIFTTDVIDGESNYVKKQKRAKSDYERKITEILVDEGSDRTIRHDYGEVFAKYLEPLTGKNAKIIEIGGLSGSGVRSLMRILPDATVYGVCRDKDIGVAGAMVVPGDGYSPETWKSLPADFDLIIDDGSHRERDMLRGLPSFVSHLKKGGVLLIEDIPTDACISSLMRELPSGIRYDTTRISEKDDDRIFVYVKE